MAVPFADFSTLTSAETVTGLTCSALLFPGVSSAAQLSATIDDFKRVAAMAWQLDLDRFITHRLPLDDVKGGMEIMKKREGLKVVLDVAAI